MKNEFVHYIYYSYEENGRGYIGSRSCKCPPQEDDYFGSYKDKAFKPTKKIILAICDTKEQRYELEYFFQKLHNVVENPHFANRAFQTATGFSRLGLPNSEESRQKMSESRKNKPSGMKGKRHSQETKRKIANSLKGKPCPTRAVKWTDERRAAHSKALIGKKGCKHSEETKQLLREKNSIRLFLKNLKTEEVKEFSSQVQAAKFLKVRQGVVSNLYRRKSKKIGDWVLCDEEGCTFLSEFDGKRKCKKIRLVHVGTSAVFEFRSAKEAAHELGVCASTIYKITRGRTLVGYRVASEKDPTDSD